MRREAHFGKSVLMSFYFSIQVVRHHAQTARIHLRRNILVDQILDAVENPTIGVVDEDQFVAHGG